MVSDKTWLIGFAIIAWTWSALCFVLVGYGIGHFLL